MLPVKHQQVAAGVVVTASGVIGAAFQSLSNHPKEDVVVFLRITAASGTSPSLTVNFQGSADGTNWATIQSFTAQTAATAAGVALRLAMQDIIDPWFQLTATVSGTTPSFTVSIDVFESSDS